MWGSFYLPPGVLESGFMFSVFTLQAGGLEVALKGKGSRGSQVIRVSAAGGIS